MLWLNHHSFEELPDALEYNLVNTNSDLEDDLTNLALLDQRGVTVTIHTQVTMTIHTLLDWAKFFLATNGSIQNPDLYDLLDTSRCVFIAAKLHLHFPDLYYPNLP